ncbi:MAG: MBL fold metallo-hydrolase [Alphaproteobacteria bacterium]|nr:MBL fold metallo-hydrolase [Alphaproteobacteria bacterium]
MTNTATQPPFQVRVVPVTPLQQNCTIIRAPSGKAAVIDPGGEPEKILQAAKEFDAKIEQIWLTHGHLDHAGGAEGLKRATGAPIIGPQREDKFWLEAIADQWAQYGHPGMGENCAPDKWLEDGDTLDLDGIIFNVAYTPGHTPGHVVIYHEGANIAFVGDVLFAGSVGRTDFPRGDQQTLINSITQKLWPLGDMQFVSGHGPVSTFGKERQNNPFVADKVTGYQGTEKVAENTVDQKLSKRWQ